MRVFISVDVPDAVQKKIKLIQIALPEFKGKLTEPENLHLTLKFLGELDEEKLKMIKECLRDVKLNGFETRVDKIGVFSPAFLRIVWLHLTGCEELQKAVDESLSDLFNKEERFMSHLTIARIKKVENKKEFMKKLNRLKLPEIRFKVNSFKLRKSVLSSEGPRYETLEHYNLD